MRTEIASHDTVPQSSASDLGPQAALSDSLASSPSTSDALPPQSAACAVAAKTFCAVLEITGPYRRANEEQGLGLEAKRIEAGNPLVDGSDLGLDISLPSYDAYLALSYFLRDGTVHHVLPGRNWAWPANAREFDRCPGFRQGRERKRGDGRRRGLGRAAVRVTRPPAEAAESYLADLRRRLAEMSDADEPAQIAATLLVITPAPQQPS